MRFNIFYLSFMANEEWVALNEQLPCISKLTSQFVPVFATCIFRKKKYFCAQYVPDARLSWWHKQMETFFCIQRASDWPFERVNHRSTVDFPHKGQWRGALMFSLIWAWTNGWANNREAGDLRCHCVHCYGMHFHISLFHLRCHTS